MPRLRKLVLRLTERPVEPRRGGEQIGCFLPLAQQLRRHCAVMSAGAEESPGSPRAHLD